MAQRIDGRDFVARGTIRLTRTACRGPRFIRANLIDLIAIVPVDVFRGFRAIRVLRLLQAGAVMWRVLRTAQRILSTNKTWTLLVIAQGLVTIGGVAAAHVEPGIAGIGDGLWWAIVTATTVGYDISPATPLGRTIAAFLMLTASGFSDP